MYASTAYLDELGEKEFSSSNSTQDSLLIHSGFGTRLAALICDVIIILTVLWLLGLVQVPQGYTVGFQISPLGSILVWVYYAGLESSPLQASLGKYVTSQVVTNKEGKRIGFWQATGRTWAKLLTLMTFMLGFFSILFTYRSQALHDLISGTYVLTKGKY